MPYSIALAIMVLLILLYLYLIEPARNDGRMERFLYRPYAHRGLHDLSEGRPENSLAAFAAAADAGYGMELDVQITKDGKLVVFHDDTLTRMCGVEGYVKDRTLAELTSLTLAGTQERIPTFDEVLRLVDGRTPLIVEIKGLSGDMEVCRLVREALKGYRGDYVIESFNPYYVRWWRKNAPEVIRGQLSANLVKRGAQDPVDWLQKWAVTHLLTNFATRPDFIAYGWQDAWKLSYRFCRDLFKANTVLWTVKDEETYRNLKDSCGAVIFEGFLPPTQIR